MEDVPVEPVLIKAFGLSNSHSIDNAAISNQCPLSRHHLPHDLRQPGRLRDHHPAAAVLRADVRRVAARDRSAVRVVFAEPAGRLAAARRAVGSLGPAAGADLQPRRHGGELRDAGRRAQPGDALRRADRGRAVGRQHHDRARLHRRHHDRGEPREGLRHARRRVRPRLHRRTGARRGVLAYQLHRAHLGGGGDHRRGDGAGRGSGCRRPSIARMPDGVPRGGRSSSSWHAPHLRVLFTIDFLYWMAFAVYQTTFALFGARRFGVRRRAHGLSAQRVRLSRRRRAGRTGRSRGHALGERRTLGLGLAVRRHRLGRKRADALRCRSSSRCSCRARSASACATRR